MLSYQHAYHAGNFADVLKHTALCATLDYLLQKDKPLYFHDSHAGRGLYPLALPEMQKTREHEQGIARIWQTLADNSQSLPALQSYFKVLKSFNHDGVLRQYPGSGLFAQALLRDSDELLLTELHPAEFAFLQKNTGFAHNIRAQQVDAWQALKSSLPPRQKRGLILIDPSYELKNEQQQVIDAVAEALRRFATGVYLLWYPLLGTDPLPKKLIRGIEQLQPPSLLRIELSIAGAGQQKGLTGSGMLLINAPWQLDKQMREILPVLQQQLAHPGQGDWRVQWLIAK